MANLRPSGPRCNASYPRLRDFIVATVTAVLVLWPLRVSGINLFDLGVAKASCAAEQYHFVYTFWDFLPQECRTCHCHVLNSLIREYKESVVSDSLGVLTDHVGAVAVDTAQTRKDTGHLVSRSDESLLQSALRKMMSHWWTWACLVVHIVERYCNHSTSTMWRFLQTVATHGAVAAAWVTFVPFHDSMLMVFAYFMATVVCPMFIEDGVRVQCARARRVMNVRSTASTRARSSPATAPLPATARLPQTETETAPEPEHQANGDHPSEFAQRLVEAVQNVDTGVRRASEFIATQRAAVTAAAAVVSAAASAYSSVASAHAAGAVPAAPVPVALQSAAAALPAQTGELYEGEYSETTPATFLPEPSAPPMDDSLSLPRSGIFSRAPSKPWSRH